MSVITLTEAQQKFILHWGEMGTRWGINRTVAQTHALLYLWPEPLHADQIAGALSVARSNVSTSLRDLQGWGIVRVTHVLGDRRDHFESLKDVWQMFEIILAERKRREFDPTVAALRGLASDDSAGDYTRQRLHDMLTFFETISACYTEFERLPKGSLAVLAKLRGKWRSLLAGTKKR